MAQNRKSLSEQSQKRGNLILLIIGIVLMMLFLLALCQMSPKKQSYHQPEDLPELDSIFEPLGAKKEEKGLGKSYKMGEGRLLIKPNSLKIDSVVGKVDQADIVLKAENAPILIQYKKLEKADESPFVLSGSCMEDEKDRLDMDEECTIVVSWQSQKPQQLGDTLLVEWREDNPRVMRKERTTVPLNVQVLDSNPCVICKCEEKIRKAEAVPPQVATATGKLLPVDGEKNTVKIGDEEVPIPDDPWLNPKNGEPIFKEPKYIPLNLKNELIGKIAENRDVLDFNGDQIGRLLDDNTIISNQMEVLGKAIPVVPAMQENGEIIGVMEVDEENKTVRIVDAKKKLLGYPRIDKQVIDPDGKPIAFLSPSGLVMNFNGDILGGIAPTKDSSGKKYMLGVMNSKKQILGYMRPMGLAVDKKGALIGGVVPSGIAVGAGCQSFGTVAFNGQVFDKYKQNIGHVLLDKAVVDAQNNELGSVVRQGVVINENSEVLGFINSEAKAVNFKGAQIGCVNPDGSVFADEKFVGAVMPEGRVIADSCNQVGSVYPDGKIMSLDLQTLGRVLPNGTAQGEQKNIGRVTPWGTAIAQECQLLGLISLNGTVVSTNGSLLGCITRDDNVQDLQGTIIGMVTPTGIQMNAKNQVIGRVGMDGHIIDLKGQVIGCVNSAQRLPEVMPNSTRGVVVDENGRPLGWSFVAGKTYNSRGTWMGDVLFNGWVIGEKNHLIGAVPFSGTVFSDKGEIVGQYDQMSGAVTNKTGASIGRVLPGMTVINQNGTEILGVLIPEKTVFVDMQGKVIGTLQTDGTLMHQGQEIPAKILANGSLVDEKGRILGARLPVGPVLSASSKYIGFVTVNGDFLNESGMKMGYALANGLVISEQKQVLGKVFPSLVSAVSVDGWLGTVNPQLVQDNEQSTYQGQVIDGKGNLVGSISAYGAVLGIDQSIKGGLVPIAPFITTRGQLLGWGNFRGGVNGPDGRSVATVLPSGLAVNPSQQIQGMLVYPQTIVGTRGEYLGQTTSKGQLLSDKGEVLALVGMSRFVYDVQGVLLGQVLPPGVALDADGRLLGWTRYDGQIEDGSKVIGQVGLDGHVFDENGQMIGAYLPLGQESFSNTNKSLGVINEKGMVQSLNGTEVAHALLMPFVSSEGLSLGRLLERAVMTAALNIPKTEGIVSPNGNVYSLMSHRESGVAMTNDYTSGNAGLIDGAILPKGLAISSTLGLLGQVYPDGNIYHAANKVGSSTGSGFIFSASGDLLGGIFPPGLFIDRKGAIVATSGPSAAVMNQGKQVGNKMAFTSALTTTNKWLGNLMPRGFVVDDMSEVVGGVSLDGSVIDKDNVFKGRILPDGSLAGVPQKSVYNTMPYIGQTVVQGLPLGYKKEVLGRTTVMGDIIDKDNRAIGRILDDESVLDDGKKLSGIIIPFVSAVAIDGTVLGTVSSDGKIVSYVGENKGVVAHNKTVKGSGDLDIIGRLVPEELIVNDCKVVGQTAYDGRVINGQGAVVGRIRRDRWAIDAQGNEIGRAVIKHALLTTEKTGKYVGRTLPDGIVVDVNGVEVACANNQGEIINTVTGAPWVDPETGEAVGLVVRGPVLGEDGTLRSERITAHGQLITPEGNVIGVVLGNKENTIVDLEGNKIEGLRIVRPSEELVWDPQTGKVIGTFEDNGDYRNTKGEIIFNVTETGDRVTKWGVLPGKGSEPIGILANIGYFKDCDLFGFDGNKKASLMADGQLLDESGNLFGFVSPDGSVSAPNRTFIGKIEGYKVDLQKCGLPPPGEPGTSTGRKFSVGGRTFQETADGGIADESGHILGWPGKDGHIYDLNGDRVDLKSPNYRPRPAEKPSIKINPEDMDTVRQKMAEKRQKMRQGLGGAPLTMTAEMQARFGPKKDKDWKKVGVGKDSISSWAVDMSRVILQGRSIPAVLARPIDSRFSDSAALAIVDTNIYAEEGRNILIPAGSQLIGRYGGEGVESIRQGVAKVNIIWDRLIRPDGVAFNLGGSPSADIMGRGGIAAYLDEQLMTKYGTAMMGTVAQSAIAYMIATNDDAQMSDSGNSSQSNKSQAANDARTAFVDTFGQIVDDWIEHAKEVPPVVYVPMGTRFNVVLTQDLWLRSAEDDEESVDEEFGPPTASAQKPDMPSWEENRRQQLNDMGTKNNNKKTGNTQSKQSQSKQDAQDLKTPLYDGSDHMQEEPLEDRVVEPVTSSQTPPLFN